MGKYVSIEDYIESLKNMEAGTLPREGIIRALEALPNISAKPLHLKKGDVFMYPVAGAKHRPVVIIKIEEEMVYGFALSSTEDELNLCPSVSRFFGKGFISKGLVVCKKSWAVQKFAGIYDNPKRLHSAVKMFKEQLNSIN